MRPNEPLESELPPLRKRSARFFVWLDGGTSGPYVAAQLIELAAQGKVNIRTPAMVDGRSDWRTVGDFVPLHGRAAWPLKRVAPILGGIAIIVATVVAMIVFRAHSLQILGFAVAAPLALGFYSLALGLYFLPTIIGQSKRNNGAIFALNLLAGWTFVGWVVACVWACTKDSEKA